MRILDKHLHASDWVVMLSAQGQIIRQGQFMDLGLKDDPSEWLTVNTTSSSEMTQHDTILVPPTVADQRKLDALKDLKRRTGDISLYLYYMKSIGWPACFIFFALSVLYAFATVFPRRSNYYQMWRPSLTVLDKKFGSDSSLERRLSAISLVST